jgi:hypothetical protein
MGDAGLKCASEGRQPAGAGRILERLRAAPSEERGTPSEGGGSDGGIDPDDGSRCDAGIDPDDGSRSDAGIDSEEGARSEDGGSDGTGAATSISSLDALGPLPGSWPSERDGRGLCSGSDIGRARFAGSLRRPLVQIKLSFTIAPSPRPGRASLRQAAKA